MGISKDEKNKRTSKKSYENLDQAIASKMEDPDMIAGMLDWLAKNDPKRFFDTVMARMPKVQPIDQDLQKTFISLKAMMEDLPEVENIIAKLIQWKKKAGALAFENKKLQLEINSLREKQVKAS